MSFKKNNRTGQQQQQVPKINWDDIETRSVDSIRSDNNLNRKKNQPKLFTFYDYLNNNNNNNNNSNNPNSIRNKSDPYKNYKSNNYNPNEQYQLNPYQQQPYSQQQPYNQQAYPNYYQQQYQHQQQQIQPKPRKPIRYSEEDEEEYEGISDNEMPISSGFGGYTNTTRRKPREPSPDPEPQPSKSRPVMVKKVYTNTPVRKSPVKQTIIVENKIPTTEVIEEPQEIIEIVKPKPSSTKKKIIYLENDTDQSQESEIEVIRTAPSINKQLIATTARSKLNEPVVYYINDRVTPKSQSPVLIRRKEPETQVMYVTSSGRKSTRVPKLEYVLTEDDYDENEIIQYVQEEPPRRVIYQNATPSSSLSTYDTNNQYVLVEEPVRNDYIYLDSNQPRIIYR